MIRKVKTKDLKGLIEEHRKEKVIYRTYEFDNDSYMSLLCDINSVLHQLEEKDKLISSLNHQLGKTSETIGKLYSEEYIEKQQLISFLENKITENKELIEKIKSYQATGYGIDMAICKIKMIKEVLDFVNGSGKDGNNRKRI